MIVKAPWLTLLVEQGEIDTGVHVTPFVDECPNAPKWLLTSELVCLLSENRLQVRPDSAVEERRGANEQIDRFSGASGLVTVRSEFEWAFSPQTAERVQQLTPAGFDEYAPVGKDERRNSTVAAVELQDRFDCLRRAVDVDQLVFDRGFIQDGRGKAAVAAPSRCVDDDGVGPGAREHKI